MSSPANLQPLLARLPEPWVSDAELVRRGRDDPVAFVALCARYARALHCWILGRVRDQDVAEELLAETFAEALRGLRRCHADGDAGAGGWLFGIARNLVRKRARRYAQDVRIRRQLALLGDASVSDDPPVEVDAARQQLAAALASLPEGQRRAVLLRVAEEETYVSIAEALKCSVGAARIRVSRGLQTLAASMKE